VLDGQSDLLVTGEVGTRNGPSVDAVYRRRFNDGTVTINGAIGRIGDGVGGYVFNKGQFNIDDTWRWGFDINRASSIQYMRDFRVAGTQSTLTSQVYLEGFGQGAYTRLDARAYQPLTSTLNNDHLPFVLPRYSYSYFGEPDALGGRSSAELGFFNVLRNSGTNTQRGRASFAWNDSPTGRLGDRWTFTLNVDSAAYTAQDFNLTPNYGAQSNVQSAQAMPTAAAMLRWPFQRDAGSWGTQILEPMAQIIVAPQGSSYLTTQIPNEDSLDQDFTDANLFSLNRFPGVDRLEGGPRANVALHGVWFLPNGANLDALIGQAYRTRDDFAFNVNSGLRKTASDVVTHLAYTPNANFDIMTRERFDHRTGQIRYVDAVATTGPSWLRLNTGYLYTPDDPYQFYDSNPPPTAVTTPRNEVQAGASTRFGVWRGDINARRDLQSNKMVSLGVGGAYEDECVIFDVHYFRRYTSIAGDSGSTTILFQVTLKTVGQFGFHAQ
jgi:LPS-assembly protein